METTVPDRINLTLKERFAVLRRDRFTCQYCGARAPNARLYVDHVVPVAAGGGNEPTNLVAACFECNAGKGVDRVPLFELQWRVWNAVKHLPRVHGATTEESWYRDRTREMVDACLVEDFGELPIEAAQLSVESWEAWRQYCHDFLTENYVHMASPPRTEDGRPLRYPAFVREDLDEEYTNKFRPWVLKMRAESAAKGESN